MESALGSAIHLLGVTIAFTCVVMRDRAMKPGFDAAARERLFAADNWSGIAAMMLIGAGLWRLFGGLQKPTDWYLRDHAFWLKMGLLGTLMGLEMVPMVTFIRWRVQIAKGLEPDTRRLPLIRLINRIEIVGYVLIVCVATVMARGLWHARPSSAGCAVEELVAARCLTCHGSAAPQGGLVLASGLHAAVVGVPSAQWPDPLRVAPGDPAASLLWRKLTGQQAPHGVAMPMGQPLDAELAAEVEAWIRAGAPACQR